MSKRLINFIFIFLFLLLFIGCAKPNPDRSYAKPKFLGFEVINSNDSFSNTSFSINNMSQENTVDIEDKIKESTNIIESTVLDLYTSVNQNIFIKIKLDNPYDKEIISVKINDNVFQNYYFEEGSDSNNIILEFSTPQTPRIIEYKLQEIKYIELEKEEFVEIDKDDTLKVGLAHNLIPTVGVSNFSINSTKITFNTYIKDVNDVGKYYKLYLFDGSNLLEIEDLSKNYTYVEIDELKPNSIYQYAIVTECDLLDGSGNQLMILNKQTFETKDFALVNIYNEYNNNAILPNLDNNIILEFDNPSNYQIEEINILDTIYTKDTIEVIDNNHVKVSINNNQTNFVRKETINVKEVTLLIEGNRVTKEIQKEVDFWTMKSLEFRDVSTPEELKNMENGYSYKFTSDIDLQGNWPSLNFEGILDGNGYSIINSDSNNLNKCLFKTFSGELKNLEFISFNIYSTGSSSPNASPLIQQANNESNMINCILNADINMINMSPSDFNFGGFVALNTGNLKISNSKYMGNINISFTTGQIFNSIIGGFVGNSSGLVTLNNVEMNGEVTIDSKQNLLVGGLIGSSKAVIENSTVEGDMYISKSSSLSLGGIIGDSTDSLAENCMMNGNITVKETGNNINVSGIGNFLKTINNCVTTGNISVSGNSNALVGGIAVSLEKICISDSEMLGNLDVNSVTADVGGVAVSPIAIISNCNMSGNITVDTNSSTYVGGILGASTYDWFNKNEENQYEISEIDNCQVTGTITATTKYSLYVGGVTSVGNASITRNSVSCDIDINSNSVVYVGGIIAEGKIIPLIEDCSFNGNLTIKSQLNAYVGGILGYHFDSAYNNMNINKVSVNGQFTVETYLRTYTGGLIGYMDRGVNFKLTINNSKFEGNIDVKTDHNSFAGGLIAHSGPFIKIDNSLTNGTIKADAGASAYVGGFVASGTLSINNSLMISNLEATSVDVSYMGGFIAYNKYFSALTIEDCIMLGNISLTSNKDNYVHPYLAFNTTNASVTLNNCFVGESSIIQINELGQEYQNISIASKEQLNSKLFYTDDLHFDESCWDISSLNHESKKYPTLIN